jgi:hypothetical protein
MEWNCEILRGVKNVNFSENHVRIIFYKPIVTDIVAMGNFELTFDRFIVLVLTQEYNLVLLVFWGADIRLYDACDQWRMYSS